MSMSILTDIIEDLEGIDKSNFPSLSVLETLVQSCVEPNCTDVGILREVIMKIYFIVQKVGEQDLDREINVDDINWILKSINDYSSEDISRLYHQDFLDILSTRIVLEDFSTVPQKMSHIMTIQRNLERLWARFATGHSEESIKQDITDLVECNAELLRGLIPFINSHLKMSGSLPVQSEMALANGDFETAFLVLGDEIKRLEKRLRISSDKSRASDELETFLCRLQEIQLEEALKGVDWDKDLYQNAITYRKSLLDEVAGDTFNEELAPVKKPVQRPTRAARRRMSSLASFLTAQEQDPEAENSAMQPTARNNGDGAEINDWIRDQEALIKQKTDSFSLVCEQHAATLSRQLELENVAWYTKHISRRALVRSKLDKSRTILADRFLANVKEIREKHSSILNKARDVYVGGIHTQRKLEKQAQERLENPNLAPAEDPYSLSQSTSSKRKNAKGLNLVFCKAAILNALDKLQNNQLQQFEETQAQSKQLPTLVDDIRRDVELFSTQYLDRVSGLHIEAFQRFSNSITQSNEMEMKVYRETGIGRRTTASSSKGSKTDSKEHTLAKQSKPFSRVSLL